MGESLEDKPELRLIKTSEIINNKEFNEEIEWVFVDIVQLQRRVKWLKKSLKDHIIWKSGYNEESVNDMIDQAFPTKTEKGK